ncbi:hypothetical protein G4G28_08105 [Massilia sp. Dwa41.01b]|uniref:hypothetical protein n=1 Tax=Massilia sp. Dwa41.01b TaxID=2709302 RepID=UPI00160353A4|nr:hypothetical protein [Massilia sp. Dwa41.01b]QNA88464.1 hypothetical protein G4G28_08105 [Massilia sp. Dwa41.01b]
MATLSGRPVEGRALPELFAGRAARIAAIELRKSMRRERAWQAVLATQGGDRAVQVSSPPPASRERRARCDLRLP